MRTFVDRGGTFTDVVVLQDDGRVQVRKVPSDTAIVGDLAQGPLTFGTTVATNALLERTGVPTLLVVSEGLGDLVRIGDMTRPELFDPDARWPEPLCTRVVEVPGRIDGEGSEIEPLVLPHDLDVSDVEAVAVVLHNSARSPAHELAVGAWLRERWPDVHVALGHRIDPELGLLARIETTLVDAAITPVLADALRRDRIPADALALRSDGSLSPAAELVAPDAVLSGPSGGVVAVAAVARQAGFTCAVGLDMGGTSTDVCRVALPDLPRRDGQVRVAGVRVRRPMLEVDTIAAGGGSVLWTDGLRLGVGPRSAGADPGPQCYGRGGPPTLTDAALVAGLVDAEAFDPPLQVSAVTLPGRAEEFLDVARDQMAAAIRTLAARRGLDLHDHALVAFGGAAGQHACGVADRLGVRTVLVHPCAAVLSAWGQVLARREEAAVRALWRPLAGAFTDVQHTWELLEASLPALGECTRTVELRHLGTDHALEVSGDDEETLRAAFAAEHRRRFGFDRDRALEVVNVRVRVRAPLRSAPRVDADPWGLGTRAVRGPARVDAPTTSVFVADGWLAQRVDGLLRLERTTPAPRALPEHRTPHGVALWSSRFMSVAEEAGATLQRLARSVNIRERLDFSCAVFDESGHLVANAPHIPVHLGAMGATVRDLLQRVPELPADQAWLCNDPAAGGSHLPDLTVVTPVHHDGRRFFVACRGHHVDVGGTTPGSMPPRSERLSEEGFVVRHLPLLDGHRLRDDLEPFLVGCREPELVRADLEAQIAANAQAARDLVALGPAELIAAWMAHLQDVAAEAVSTLLEGFPPGPRRAQDELAHLPLRVRLEVVSGRLQVDWTGTGGPHSGNLNAPPAVVRAAVLYALRVLVGRPIPLNEGALRAVDLVVPSPSLLDPPEGAAVAGGNVETSQRLVDLVLRAAGHMAASAGTMSNLTLGGQGWSLYETVGGGEGGSPRGDGASGRQVHMTNTRATDPEVLEARLPVRVRRFALRPGTGGDGAHRGGDGLIRELEVLKPATVSLLATRRRSGAPGLAGGCAGVPGQDALRRGGVWQDWDGSPTPLEPGDRVRVGTPGGGGHGTP